MRRLFAPGSHRRHRRIEGDVSDAPETACAGVSVAPCIRQTPARDFRRFRGASLFIPSHVMLIGLPERPAQRCQTRTAGRRLPARVAARAQDGSQNETPHRVGSLAPGSRQQIADYVATDVRKPRNRRTPIRELSRPGSFESDTFSLFRQLRLDVRPDLYAVGLPINRHRGPVGERGALFGAVFV